MEEDYAKRAERIKSLLSSYYGADGPATDGQDGGASAAGQHAMQAPSAAAAAAAQRTSAAGAGPLLPGMTAMDSPSFNREEHVAQLLRSQPLDKLITEHRTLTRQIKHLDSNMQQLVYENYNKFISATDTIRTMKSKVEGMSSEMNQLKGALRVLCGGAPLSSTPEKSHSKL